MKVRNIVAMAQVASVSRSIDFYAKLGFDVGNTFAPASEKEPTWAWLQSDRGELMIARAEGRTTAERSVLFYLYCDDVAQARESLQASGIVCGEITFPFYAPRGEFEIRDPDGYTLMVTHT